MVYKAYCDCGLEKVLRAELAAKDARIAELEAEFEAYKVNYEYNDVDLDMAVELEMTLRKTAETRAECAEARVAELENKHE